jgi:superfamily I DNA/RNA helicase
MSKGLNCEKIYNRKGDEYYSIRVIRPLRMMYVERDVGIIFFAVNFHDYDAMHTPDFSAIEPHESLKDWDPKPDDKPEEPGLEPDSDIEDDEDLLPCPFPLGDADVVPNKRLMDLGVLFEDIETVRGIRDEDELLDVLEKNGRDLPQHELICLFDDPTLTRLDSLLLNRAKHGLISRDKDVDGGRPEELDYWRAASLERFRRWFSPDQRDAVMAEAPGPLVVLGAAGTGKTVVALHRANYLARAVFNKPGDRILLTTFSRTLAQDLERQLDEVCADDPEARARIDVRNVDDAMVAFLNANGVGMEMEFDRFDDRVEVFMKRAAREVSYTGDRRPGWLWQEYTMAIESADITRESNYVGRVLPGPEPKPDDAEKKKLWPVFRRFEDTVAAQNFWTPGRAANKAVKMLTPGGGAKPETRYSAAVVDETQDMSRERLRFLAAIVGYDPASPAPDALTFFGDARQRIYDHGASLRSAGISVRAEMQLRRNYRSTEEIRKRAERFLEGVPMDDLDDDLVVRDPSPAARKGVPPEERRCEDSDEEASVVAEAIRRWIDEDSRQPGSPNRQPGEYAVLSPSNRRVRLLRDKLEALGLPSIVVTAARPPDDLGQVRVMTLHRAKGLEFQGVILDLDAENWPMTPHAAKTLPEKERIRRANRAKCLAYVGMTRAIRRVLLTGVGPAPEGV